MKSVTFAALTAAAFALCGAARADVTIVQKTVIDAPGVRQMLREIPEERRGPLLGMLSPMVTGVPWITTTYMKGPRMREDMGQTTVIINAKAGHALTIDNVKKRYSIGPYDPFQKAAGNMTCHIEPTSETAGMLGYIVHKYAVTMTATVLSKATITGEIWATTGLPTPPDPGYLTGNAVEFQTEMAKIKGMPLAYKLTYANTPAGDISVVSYATSIKNDKLSEADFEVPDGYQRGSTRVATGMPSAGFPLGDGMPLDSNSPVTDQMATGNGPAVAGNLGGGTGDLSKLLGNMSPQQMQQLMGSLGGGGGAGSADAGALGGMSPQVLQQLLGSLGGGLGGSGGGAGSADGGGLGGMSPQVLQQLLGSLGGMSGGSGGGDSSSLISPQMLQQLSGLMQQLNDSDQ